MQTAGTIPRPTVPEQLVNRTVLVTGGAGFIGSHIAGALTEVCDVRVLDDLSAGDRDAVPGEAMFVEGDVRDDVTVTAAMADIDVVFHQAGRISVDASFDDPAATQTVNTQGTVTVLECARAAGADVVVASSAAIYGPPTDIPIEESTRKRPTSPYGISKLGADRFTQLYDSEYDMDAVALRYFNVYGPSQRADEYGGVISIFADRARDGKPLTVHGDGAQTRDFVHVRDVVQANLLAATADRTASAYNVGTGTQTSIADLAETIRRRCEGSPSVTHTDPRTGDIIHSQAAIDSAREELGYEPTVSLKDGLDSLIEHRNWSDPVSKSE